eukprot:363930-Chlamydomonas_euryale.AAC.5
MHAYCHEWHGVDTQCARAAHAVASLGVLHEDVVFGCLAWGFGATAPCVVTWCHDLEWGNGAMVPRRGGACCHGALQGGMLPWRPA